MAKRNTQFRIKIFHILYEFPELTTQEIFDKYCELNPKSVPAYNRFSQLMKSKWFQKVGWYNSRAVINGRKQKRCAVWEIVPEYREYPPMWTPRSGKMLHDGGKNNYILDDDYCKQE